MQQLLRMATLRVAGSESGPRPTPRCPDFRGDSASLWAQLTWCLLVHSMRLPSHRLRSLLRAKAEKRSYAARSPLFFSGQIPAGRSFTSIRARHPVASDSTAHDHRLATLRLPVWGRRMCTAGSNSCCSIGLEQGELIARVPNKKRGRDEVQRSVLLKRLRSRSCDLRESPRPRSAPFLIERACARQRPRRGRRRVARFRSRACRATLSAQ